MRSLCWSACPANMMDQALSASPVPSAKTTPSRNPCSHRNKRLVSASWATVGAYSKPPKARPRGIAAQLSSHQVCRGCVAGVAWASSVASPFPSHQPVMRHVCVESDCAFVWPERSMPRKHASDLCPSCVRWPGSLLSALPKVRMTFLRVSTLWQ